MQILRIITFKDLNKIITKDTLKASGQHRLEQGIEKVFRNWLPVVLGLEVVVTTEAWVAVEVLTLGLVEG